MPTANEEVALASALDASNDDLARTLTTAPAALRELASVNRDAARGTSKFAKSSARSVLRARRAGSCGGSTRWPPRTRATCTTVRSPTRPLRRASSAHPRSRGPRGARFRRSEPGTSPRRLAGGSRQGAPRVLGAQSGAHHRAALAAAGVGFDDLVQEATLGLDGIRIDSTTGGAPERRPRDVDRSAGRSERYAGRRDAGVGPLAGVASVRHGGSVGARAHDSAPALRVRRPRAQPRDRHAPRPFTRARAPRRGARSASFTLGDEAHARPPVHRGVTTEARTTSRLTPAFVPFSRSDWRCPRANNALRSPTSTTPASFPDARGLQGAPGSPWSTPIAFGAFPHASRTKSIAAPSFAKASAPASEEHHRDGASNITHGVPASARRRRASSRWPFRSRSPPSARRSSPWRLPR